MEPSILKSTKKILGLAPDYTAYDAQIITHINSAFTTLNQLDLNATEGFKILGYDETWFDYSTDVNLINQVKNFIHLNTRLMFDPPTSGFDMQRQKDQIAEVTWRLSTITTT